MTTKETVKFDPGWGCHVLVYSGSVEYLYRDINKFKNTSQKSFKFKLYFPKILQLLLYQKSNFLSISIIYFFHNILLFFDKKNTI